MGKESCLHFQSVERFEQKGVDFLAVHIFNWPNFFRFDREMHFALYRAVKVLQMFRWNVFCKEQYSKLKIRAQNCQRADLKINFKNLRSFNSFGIHTICAHCGFYDRQATPGDVTTFQPNLTKRLNPNPREVFRITLNGHQTKLNSNWGRILSRPTKRLIQWPTSWWHCWRKYVCTEISRFHRI
jgi:hypothetical protein